MHDFIGKWRITWMETWVQDYVDLEGPGYFEFTEDNLGEFMFGAMHGWLDVRVSHRTPMLEFSWQGECEGDHYCGRGIFEFPDQNNGEGMLYIHCGDQSAVKIERQKT